MAQIANHKYPDNHFNVDVYFPQNPSMLMKTKKVINKVTNERCYVLKTDLITKSGPCKVLNKRREGDCI